MLVAAALEHGEIKQLVPVQLVTRHLECVQEAQPAPVQVGGRGVALELYVVHQVVVSKVQYAGGGLVVGVAVPLVGVRLVRDGAQVDDLVCEGGDPPCFMLRRLSILGYRPVLVGHKMASQRRLLSTSVKGREEGEREEIGGREGGDRRERGREREGRREEGERRGREKEGGERREERERGRGEEREERGRRGREGRSGREREEREREGEKWKEVGGGRDGGREGGRGEREGGKDGSGDVT